MDNKPLDYQEPDVIPGKESPIRSRNKKLTFYLEIIPLTLLVLGITLQYLEQPTWRVVFATGAVLACVIYILSTLLLLWRRKYGWIEGTLMVLAFLFFACASYAIYLQFFNLERAYFFRMYTRWFGMGVLTLAILGFIFRIRDSYFSEYYRRLLTRVLGIVAILFKGIL